LIVRQGAKRSLSALREPMRAPMPSEMTSSSLKARREEISLF
jgi:hypothetical protein